MMDTLLREGNPPTGQLASPKPQYKKPGVDEYEPVEGQHGAPFATLKDASGNVVSPATDAKLEQVRQLLAGVATEAKLEQARVLLNAISNKDFATQATLEGVQSELALIKSELDNIKQNQTSGDQKVQLSGTKVELLKEWSDTGLMSRVEWFYGNNRSDAGSLLMPVNYSAKPRKMILVRNLFDVAVACTGVYGFKDGTTRGAIVYLPLAEEVLIEANASVLLTSETVPELDYNFPGIALRFMRKGTPTTGTLDIWFFGGEGGASKDFATQTTLAAVLAKLADLERELATIKANQLSGDQKVQLSGTDVVIGLLADRPPASEMWGRGYYAWDETDGHKLKYSDGTDWVVNQ